MPRLVSFSIRNFKGINHLDLDIAKRNKSPVITLIGLNESGKTTILEALSYFVSNDEYLTKLFDVRSANRFADLIPIHRKAAFTGKIEISAAFEWEESDTEIVKAAAAAHGTEVDLDRMPKELRIIRWVRFEDSTFRDSGSIWNVMLYVRKTRRSKFKLYERPTDTNDDLWLKIANSLGGKLPTIAYFPTFLVDTPERIYLSESEDETAVNRYYRLVIQEILSSVDPALSIERHVIKRLSDAKEGAGAASWLSLFWGGPAKGQIDSVFQKISNALTREVIVSWSKVFKRSSGAKNVSIDWNVDTEKDDAPYLSFFVSDGDSRYSVSERSLGFRWFFSFLLFTTFKQSSSKSTLFLFDEPAANLHAKAQAELLTNFERITSSNNRIIYSTHSHHMINPRWLSAAFIVENTSIDYDSNDSFELNSKPTDVIATPYRHFVSQSPTRASYFQPIVEKLEYVSPEIVGSSPYLLVEGITDYYALKYVANFSGGRFDGFRIMPGTGAGASGPLISYMIGRGDRFIVVLDDDKPGRRAEDTYTENYFLSSGTALTIGKINARFQNMRLEGLIDNDTNELVKQHFSTNKSPTKKQIGLYLSEFCATEMKGALSNMSFDNILAVLDYARERLCPQ